jgi:hypothetical protein
MRRRRKDRRASTAASQGPSAAAARITCEAITVSSGGAQVEYLDALDS